MTLSPTQLSLRWLRDNGYIAEVTEHWNPHARIRNDLFGFVDVLAIRDTETLAVQTTSAANVPARVRKIRESDLYPKVLAAGWQVRVHGWAKKSGRWHLQRDVAPCPMT